MSEVKVVRDEQGNAIVIIPDIIFWNKQDIDWDAVKEYLKKYLGEIIENKQTKEKIEIGTKFADEYTGSKYSEHIRGARAKAKANAAQGIRELVESAANKIHSENKKSKHKKDAKGGRTIIRSDLRYQFMITIERQKNIMFTRGGHSK